MRSNKHSKKTKTRTRTRTKRTYKKGGDTSSDIIRLEEGLGPRKDTYVIDIKPSSSPRPSSRSHARSSSSIPPPPFGTPPSLPDSDSFKSVIEKVMATPISQKNRKNSFPYESVVYNPDDIEGMVHDNRPFPPKASPMQFEVSPPLARKKPDRETYYKLFMSDMEDYNVPFSDRKPLPSKIILRDGRVENQGFNPLESWSAEKERPSDLGFGIRFGRRPRKTKRRHNKHSKKHHKKTRR